MLSDHHWKTFITIEMTAEQYKDISGIVPSFFQALYNDLKIDEDRKKL